MEVKRSLEKVTELLKKYRYVCIVVLAGIILMTLPIGVSKQEAAEPKAETSEIPSMELRLTNILAQIRGAGKVSVMLTEAAGEETVFQENNSSSGQKDTVTVTDKDRNESGLIVQILPPRYLGAVVVCQGADDPQVRLAIAEAVSSLTGLGTDKITIVKMK